MANLGLHFCCHVFAEFFLGFGEELGPDFGPDFGVDGLPFDEFRGGRVEGESFLGV